MELIEKKLQVIINGLGLIDFETKKCFENVEFIGNEVKGSAGWAINGNSKVNRNFVIRDNYWEHLGGGYPYGFELYSGYAENLVFENNTMINVGVKAGIFTNNFTFINNEIKRRLTEKKIRYYRQLAPSPTINDQVPR